MKRVVWGVLGTAKIGRDRVLPGMKKSSLLEIRAIASRDADRARRTADALGIPKAYGSYEALLADPEIEAIYNPLPNHLHVPLTLQAAAAGKHVLCEKPIAMTAQEATAAAARGGQGADRGGVHGPLPPAMVARPRTRARGPHRHRCVRCRCSSATTTSIRPTCATRPTSAAAASTTSAAMRSSPGASSWRPNPRAASRSIDRDPSFRTDRLTSALARFRRRQAPRLHGVDADRAVPAPPAVRQQGPDRAADSGQRAAGCADAHLDRRLLVARRRGHRRPRRLPESDQYQLQGEAFSRAVRGEIALPYGVEDAIANMRVIDALFRSERSGKWENVTE